MGYNVQLKMHVTQHIKSVNVLYAIKDLFGCGSMVVHNKLADRMRYQITAIAETKHVLIPFLEEHPLLRVQEFADWKTLITLKRAGAHRTESGKNQMLSIKAGVSGDDEN